MNLIRRVTLVFLLLFICVGCDQFTKTIAGNNFKGLPVQSYLYDTIRMSYIENVGGFLGFGNTLPQEVRFWIFTVLVAIVLTGAVLYLVISSALDTITRISVSFIAGGGISNLYDRLHNNGAVIDFVNIGLGNLRTGIFNIADLTIMLGAVLLFFIQFTRRYIE